MEKEPKRDEKEELGLPIKMEEEEFIKKCKGPIFLENLADMGTGGEVSFSIPPLEHENSRNQPNIRKTL